MAKNPEAPTRIEGKFIRVDGEEVTFCIYAGDDGNWQQWGNSADVLSSTCELIDAISEAAHEHLQDEIDDDEEDDDG